MALFTVLTRLARTAPSPFAHDILLFSSPFIVLNIFLFVFLFSISATTASEARPVIENDILVARPGNPVLAYIKSNAENRFTPWNGFLSGPLHYPARERLRITVRTCIHSALGRFICNCSCIYRWNKAVSLRGMSSLRGGQQYGEQEACRQGCDAGSAFVCPYALSLFLVLIPRHGFHPPAQALGNEIYVSICTL